MKKRMAVSFSGGKTSAFMARWLQLNKSSEYDFLFLFANTGAEDGRTLEFVDRCDREWNLNLVWLEARVREGRKSSSFSVTNYANASRAAEPFEAVIQKYGIPNQAYPHCTRELKLNPINAYVDHVGWSGCAMAVGIRADEVDRASVAAMAKGVIYPLISMIPTTRDDVELWWQDQPFNLEVPEHRGNCVWCWKKSYRKLATVMADDPEAFDFPKRMEREHGLSGWNVDGTRRTFFRKNKGVDYIRSLVERGFEPFVPSTTAQQDLFWDGAGACSESCDVYAEDYEAAA